MKLWKKLLIGVVILMVIVLGFIGYGVFKIEKTYTEKIAPDMQRYAQMATVEQDQYVLSRMTDLTITLHGEDKSGRGKAMAEAIQNDPELRQAGLAWGRAVCASIIKDDKDIAGKLTPDQLKKYKDEADDLEEKGQRFQKMLEKKFPSSSSGK